MNMTFRLFFSITRSSFDWHMIQNLLSLAWVASLSICTSYLSTPISFEVIKRIKFRPAMLLGASLSGLGKKIVSTCFNLMKTAWIHRSQEYLPWTFWSVPLFIRSLYHCRNVKVTHHSYLKEHLFWKLTLL